MGCSINYCVTSRPYIPLNKLGIGERAIPASIDVSKKSTPTVVAVWKSSTQVPMKSPILWNHTRVTTGNQI